MDGQTTLDAIWQAAAQRLGEHAPTQDQILNLLAQLHATDMLRADVVPDVQELIDRSLGERRQKTKGLLNPLSLRLPLFNPDRFLRRTVWLFAGIFSFAGLALWLLLTGTGLVLAWQNWTELSTGVSDRILAVDNLLLLAVCLPATKALHELGHGYAARRFGIPVPEVGLMLLMLLPMPYVDASAAAALRSRRRRIVVGAAGMMVETAIAAFAMILWVSVEPGLLRAIAYNVMFTASVTTVLFNGNPLMRYDGYYILSDIIEIPNLGQRATKFWSRLVKRYLFRAPDDQPQSASFAERAWFLLYAPSALIYRLMITTGIALFLAERYWVAGVVLALWTLASAVVLPVGKALRHILTAPELHRVRGRALAATGGGVAALLSVMVAIPMPNHTTVEGVVWLPETAMVRAGTDGFIGELPATSEQDVQFADVIARCEDPTLIARRDGLLARVDELQAQYQAEEFANLVDAEVTAMELDIARADLAEAQHRVERLVIRARSAGRLAIEKASDLPGRFVHEGDLIAYVLPPEGSRVVRAVVSQDDIDVVRNHLDRVELKISGHAQAVFASRVVREVPSGHDTLSSKALGSAGGGLIEVDPRDGKGVRSFRRTFEIDIFLPPGAPVATFGTRVYVRLDHERESIADQLYRRVGQTLLSHLLA